MLKIEFFLFDFAPEPSLGVFREAPPPKPPGPDHPCYTWMKKLPVILKTLICITDVIYYYILLYILLCYICESVKKNVFQL